jgi:hypothetical protein
MTGPCAPKALIARQDTNPAVLPKERHGRSTSGRVILTVVIDYHERRQKSMK